MTADAIREYANGTSWRDAGREVWQHRAEGSNAGNGSVMRCAPHAIAFADDPDTLAQVKPTVLGDHAPRSAMHLRVRRAELHNRYFPSSVIS